MYFRAHTRIALEPHWHDVGFRGTVRLENRANRFWLDVHRDVGAVTDEEDPRKLVLVSYLAEEPSAAVLTGITNPGSIRTAVVPPKAGDGFDSYPAEYRDFVSSVAHRMSNLATRALEVALWRTGARGGPPGIEVSPLQLFWRAQVTAEEGFLDSEWRQIPSGIVWVGLPDTSFFDLDAAIGSQVSQLLDEAIPQPLGHDLLREAWRIHESNPRAALVVVVAALETGLKQFIGSQLPQTDWILRNLASPPLHKIVRDLLPKIPSQAKGHTTVPAVGGAAVRAVREAVERRNSLVHVGQVEIDREWLTALFQVARRLLYQLDYHAGHEWASEVAERVHPWDREWYAKRTDVSNP